MIIAIIGGGAAGFFGALKAAATFPQAEVILYEKSPKFLSKVKVSGGGRCNVTHHCFEAKKLALNYPRGGKFLQKLFPAFGPKEMIGWLGERGVETKTEEDGRMFPITDDSQTIIDCFLAEARKLRVQLKPDCQLVSATKSSDGFVLRFKNGDTLLCDRLLATVGGYPKLESFAWLQDLGHSIVPPVPSLFTFKIPRFPLEYLSGVSVPNASVKISGGKNAQSGPLLITHTGFSGPAALKLSAHEARALAEADYRFPLQIHWNADFKEEEMRAGLESQKNAHPKMRVSNSPLFALPKRLWQHFLIQSEIAEEQLWADCPKKQTNRLIDQLTRSVFEAEGKNTFKEEFVTCGGIPLNEVGEDMQSKICPGLFFAGEVLDIDAVTGGFNFQAAWTTAWMAGGAIGR